MGKLSRVMMMLLAVAMLPGIVYAGCAPKAATPAGGPTIIKVGLPTPLNDPAAPWGKANVEPYLAWIDLFNREGFQVDGRTCNFKLLLVDDLDSPEGGAAAARQLVDSDGCKFIAGHWSWNYDAISGITNPAKVIFVTRDGGGINYNAATQPYNVFGSPSREVWVADILAAHGKFPDVKIGIMEPSNGLTQADIEVINRNYFDPAGMRYHWEVFPDNTTDFTPYISKFAAEDCGLVYTDMGLDLTMLFARQRWNEGYKWPVGQAGGLADAGIYISGCGYDAAQGLIGSYFGIWDFRETKVNPEYIAMCQEVMQNLTQKRGQPYAYTDWIGWLPSHLLMLSQAMQRAGTVDDTDAIMQAIRGGTFDTTAGTFTMSGAKTYGSAIVFGSPCAICSIQGDGEVYLAEHPLKSVP